LFNLLLETRAAVGAAAIAELVNELATLYKLKAYSWFGSFLSSTWPIGEIPSPTRLIARLVVIEC